MYSFSKSFISAFSSRLRKAGRDASRRVQSLGVEFSFHKKGGILCRGGATLLLIALLVGVGPAAQSALGQAFITTWETTSSGESITIPTDSNSVGYDFEVDWGDGTTETITGADPDPEHTYNSAGTYQVEITGTFPRIFLDAWFGGEGD